MGMPLKIHGGKLFQLPMFAVGEGFFGASLSGA